jgi:hypothetical protein
VFWADVADAGNVGARIVVRSRAQGSNIAFKNLDFMIKIETKVFYRG